jgi:predicted  nucleic acid-binding Zn-ribbon protein
MAHNPAMPNDRRKTMNDKLAQLKKELEKGQQQLALLEQRKQEVRDTMLRIAGAIQVLEEMQASASAPPTAEQPTLSATA